MIRIALVCDYKEELWPSMDHCAAMLAASLRQQRSEDLHVELFEPPFHPRASRLPLVPPAFAWNVDRLANRNYDYPRSLRERAGDFDLFHILDHSYAHLALGLPAHRTIVTCHDLETFRCLLEPETEPRSFWFKAIARRALKGFKSARHIAFVSHAVRDRALALGLVERERSSVIYNGAGDSVKTRSALQADAAVQQMLGAHASAPLLLNVGSTVTRKRIDVLLRVFAAVASLRPEVRLIRVGAPLTRAQLDLARRLRVQDSIVALPFVARPIFGALYRRATLLLHPSEAEGFGLPVVEAMAEGCPAVVSDLPVLREIGADAATYCRSGEVDAWSAAVLALLHRQAADPVFWSRLRQSSRHNAGQFRWSENARLVSALYHQAMGQPSSAR